MRHEGGGVEEVLATLVTGERRRGLGRGGQVREGAVEGAGGGWVGDVGGGGGGGARKVRGGGGGSVGCSSD